MSTLTAAWHPRLLRRGANRAEASAIRFYIFDLLSLSGRRMLHNRC